MQDILFGLTTGSIYALMALAIGIVYSTTGIINFANGSVVMTGAIIGFWLVNMIGLPLWLAILLSIVITAAVNIILYETCVKILGNLHVNIGWITTLLGASIILDNLARVIFGSEPQPFPYLFGGIEITLLGHRILLHEIAMVVITLVIAISYQAMIKKTTLGNAIRAVSSLPDSAKIMGIKSEVIIVLCFGFAGGVAAVCGILMAPITFVSYTMTMTVGLKGFAAALIGGLGNTKGAFVGGWSLGILEALLSRYIPLGLKDAVSFVIMILIILLMPGGVLSGIKLRKKAAAVKL
ncbi:branched-chain amino acid ABC transporter permease [Desulfosporosinus youngiae]|uniref:Branched-chain amino acid ABC-type transport system, permease component n=1 Tax=Desulfosporosinus youngiae DSM 17734 TaxID=768710 RepID=H5XUG5_9FIRM|nr:branched-chain amino acid ABC transporter permease [Desulfosporosinus youngiae]EHQ89401.1 branched-chain amino acid ABC-type transport system, permease component [Desulfosporosinus youngiae DSM 17734]